MVQVSIELFITLANSYINKVEDNVDNIQDDEDSKVYIAVKYHENLRKLRITADYYNIRLFGTDQQRLTDLLHKLEQYHPTERFNETTKD